MIVVHSATDEVHHALGLELAEGSSNWWTGTGGIDGPSAPGPILGRGMPIGKAASDRLEQLGAVHD